jgi:hypothetical protein
MSTAASGSGGAGGTGSFGTSGTGSGTSGQPRRREDARIPSRKLPRVKRSTKPQQSEERSGPPK